jgi:hypothetical protein
MERIVYGLNPTQCRQGPIHCAWCCSIKAVFDVIGAHLGMERFEIGDSAANNLSDRSLLHRATSWAAREKPAML